jgi:protein TonB
LKPIEKEPIKEVSWVNVQDVPIFPGCEVYKDNKERRSCMQKKLAKFIGKHFDTRLAQDLGLDGRHVIYTKFKISHTGDVIFMGARNPNPELTKEAERVIEKLPIMIPGKQNDKPVDVIFGLPINFNVNH